MALLAGALVALVPAVAGSETTPAAIKAENVGIYAHYWTPAAVKIEPGESVKISNPTEVPHGVRWIAPPGGVAPACENSVPVGTTEAASGKQWSGSCSFTKAGVYTFYCTVHGAAMSGQITVGAQSTTTTSTATTPTTTTPTTPTTTTPTTKTPTTKTPTGPTQTTPTGTTGAGRQTPSVVPEAGAAPGGTTVSLLHGSLREAVVVKPAGHGASVRGTLHLSSAAAGARLSIEVLARAGALSGTSSHASARIGRLTRSSLHAGIVSFSIDLSRSASTALRRSGHLAVTVRLLLRPAHGPAVSILRNVRLRS